MTRLLLTPSQLAAMERHAEAIHPEECCGILLGTHEKGRESRVERVLPARNERRDRRGERYVVAPEDVVAAHRLAREIGLEVVGYYHSHPGGPAEPSEFDLEHAWPEFSYLILAVGRDGVREARSWRLAPSGRWFREEELRCEDATVESSELTAGRGA